MAFDSKDFSMYLSSELIKLFGEPYQSSITTVRRFAKGNLRVYVDYERERDTVKFDGEVPIGGVTLKQNDAIAFFEEIKQASRLANTFRIHKAGKNLIIHPAIDISRYFEGGSIDQRISAVIGHINELFSHLEKMEKIITKYKKKEVGYSEIKRLWEAAKKTDNPNRKGKLLEELFVQLIQVDGNFTLCQRNVRTKSEEIDIVIQSDISSPFWSGLSSPLILLECKNWKDKVGVKEVRDFAGKIENRPKLLCRIGFLIAVSGFTSDAEEELVGYRARDFVLATIGGSEVEDLVHSKGLISDLLRRKLVDAGFR
jgi:hypothetical protein